MRSLIALPLFLFACDLQPAEDALSGNAFEALPMSSTQVAVPPVIELCKDPMAVPGTTTSVTVSGLAPGEPAFLGLGFNTGANFCPNVLGGACIDVVNPTRFGPVTSDANGDATFSLNIPAGAAIGATAYLQAAYVAGSNSAVSNVVAMTLAPADDLSACMDADVCANPDDDGDGIHNACDVGGTNLVDFEGSPDLSPFGGNIATLVVDPTDPGNMVAQVDKPMGSELWAGTTVGYCDGFGIAELPFSATDTQMSLRVWSPDAGIPVRLKVENSGNPTISVETDTLTTMSGQWETLVFDFTNQAGGTAALDVNQTYDKASVFFNFGTTGNDAGDKTYYMDDLSFEGVDFAPDCPVPPMASGVPIDFEDPNVTYSLAGFGGAEDASVEPDPTDPSNTVVRIFKADLAELWAGTTIGTGPGFSIEPLPITAGNTQMIMDVWAPQAGIPIRVKIEDANDPTRSVETEAMTTIGGSWATLAFDFANEAAGTAALDVSYTYSKISVFYNFGTDGASGGGGTFYVDNIDMAP